MHEQLLAQSREIAPKIGFILNDNRIGYKEIPPEHLMHCLQKTYLGKMLKSKKGSIYNVFERKEDDSTIYLFRYRHSSNSSSGGSFSVRQTVACFVSSKLQFPRFRLAPKKSFTKIQMFFREEGIDFSFHPQFQQSNFLQGENEDAIKKLFSESVLSHFANNQELSIEGVDDTFIFYRFDTKVEPKDLPDFYNEIRLGITNGVGDPTGENQYFPFCRDSVGKGFPGL